MVVAYVALLILVGGQRLAELFISRRNARAVIARGGREFGRGHLWALVVLHALFLPACAAEVILLTRPFHPALGAIMLGLLLAGQVLRYWTIVTLGRHWNVRILVEPGAPLVNRGPYRYIRHPNYVAVAVEGIALPLIHTAWITAVGFTVVNAWLLLRIRIPAEERALSSATAESSG
jgi:methyltransferase